MRHARPERGTNSDSRGCPDERLRRSRRKWLRRNRSVCLHINKKCATPAPNGAVHLGEWHPTKTDSDSHTGGSTATSTPPPAACASKPKDCNTPTAAPDELGIAITDAESNTVIVDGDDVAHLSAQLTSA